MLLLVSCKSSKQDEQKVIGPATVPEDPAYLDSALVASTDGQVLAFLSGRIIEAGVQAFLYRESANPKLVAVQELYPRETGLSDQSLALSNDGLYLAVHRSDSTRSYLLLSKTDGSAKVEFELEVGKGLRDLQFAANGQRFVFFTERRSGVDKVRVLNFDASLVISAELEINNAFSPQWIEKNGEQYLLSKSSNVQGDLSFNLRKRGGSPGSWTLQSQTLSTSSALLASDFASPTGLFYVENLEQTRLKLKLGTFEGTSIPGYQKNIGVLQGLRQWSIFGDATLNTSAPAYLANEPLTIGSVSADPSGQYLLLSGYDAYFCKTRNQAGNALYLVRVSDAAILPLWIVKKSDGEQWDAIFTNPCQYYDQDFSVTPTPTSYSFDTSVAKAQLLSVNGNEVNFAYESKIGGDRELRVMRFQVESWDTRTVTQVSARSISSNSPPKQ